MDDLLASPADREVSERLAQMSDLGDDGWDRGYRAGYRHGFVGGHEWKEPAPIIPSLPYYTVETQEAGTGQWFPIMFLTPANESTLASARDKADTLRHLGFYARVLGPDGRVDNSLPLV